MCANAVTKALEKAVNRVVSDIPCSEFSLFSGFNLVIKKKHSQKIQKQKINFKFKV